MSINPDGKYTDFARELQKKRKEQNMTLSELARKASISKSNLSRLESGDGNPSLETLWSLSSALSINVRDLISPPKMSTKMAHAYPQFMAKAEASNFSISLLSSCPIGSIRDIYRVKIEPGKPKVSDAHGPNIIEHIILLSGKAEAGPLNAPITLLPGDHITFSGNQQHIYQTNTKRTSAIIVMEHSENSIQIDTHLPSKSKSST